MRNRSFLIAAVVAALLAGAVWLCTPDSYVAMTTVRDEYKETDLTIGLSFLSSQLKKSLGSDNEGINDMAVYCQIIKTRDFVQVIANRRIPSEDCTYAEWAARQRRFWQSRDTLDLVNSHIEYNYSSNKQTMTIGVTDCSSVIAAQILDSVTEELQRVITDTRRKRSLAELENAAQQLETDWKLYLDAQAAYATYCDIHKKVVSEVNRLEIYRLDKEVTRCGEQYHLTKENYVRQLALTSRDYHSFTVIRKNIVPRKSQSRGWVLLLVFELVAMVLTKAVLLLRERRSEKACWEWGEWFSPWALTLIVWGGMGLALWLSNNLLEPLTSQFYQTISLWITILVITSFLTYNLLPHQTCPTPSDGMPVNTKIFHLLFFIAVVFSPLYAFRVWQIVSAFSGNEVLKDVRNLAVHGSGQGFLNYAFVISQSLLLVAMWRYPKIPMWQLIVIILCCLLNSLAIMEKGSLFLVVICIIYVLYERGKVRARHIVLFGGLIVLLFYAFNLIREGEQYAQRESLMDFIGMYVLSPPVAFCHVRPEVTDQFGTNTLSSIYEFLKRFGFNVEFHQKTQEFVYVPVATNVYTILQPFYKDFGYAGVAFFAWVYGLMSGVLYRFSRNGNALCICLYTYMVYVLILQFYQENLFLSMVFVLQLVFFVALMTEKRIKLTFKRKVS